MSNRERKALGKGLGALIRQIDEESVKKDSELEIPIEEIKLNPKQPRRAFDQEKLEELAQSIKVKGIIQPIVVRLNEEGQKELVAGERRLRAARIAGLEKVKIVLKEVPEEDLLEIALIENIQREDLNPLEEAQAYRNLLNEHGYTQENLGKRVGKNRSTIANLMRLLQLPDLVRESVANSKISVGHARALLALENDDERIDLGEKIISQGLSVRDTETLVQKKEGQKTPTPPKKISELSPQMRLNQNRLSESFSTKVVIKPAGEKGKIEFEYYNQEDFNRVFSLFLKS